MIFLLIIFVNYILSFGLVGLWTIRLFVQVFTLVRVNKNPREEMRLECEWLHAWKWYAESFGDFEKKTLVEIWLCARPVEILTLGRAVQLGATGCAFVGAVSWDLTLGEGSPPGGHGMRGAFVGSVSWDFDSELGSLIGGWLWAM